jgi:hypothetical protein
MLYSEYKCYIYNYTDQQLVSQVLSLFQVVAALSRICQAQRSIATQDFLEVHDPKANSQ